MPASECQACLACVPYYMQQNRRVFLIHPDKRKPPERLWRVLPAVSNSQLPIGRLSAQLRTAFGATVVQDLTTCFCRHTGAETMTVLANPVRWLERALHRVLSGCWPNPTRDSKPIYISDLSFRGSCHSCQRNIAYVFATIRTFLAFEMLQFVISALKKLKERSRNDQAPVKGLCDCASDVHLGSNRNSHENGQ